MAAKKKKIDDITGYERVKEIILSRVTNTLPEGLEKRKFRMTQGTSNWRRWFLLEDVESSELFLIYGETEAVAGCMDGLNVFGSSDLLVNMMRKLEIVTKRDAESFSREVQNRRRIVEENLEYARVSHEAERLGYTLTPKRKK